MTLEECLEHIGDRVSYRADGQPAGAGVITSVGITVVYVRYDGDQYSKATLPGDLTLNRLVRVSHRIEDITEVQEGDGDQ